MTEENKAQFQREGDPAFAEDTEDTTSADTQSEENEQEEGSSSDESEKKSQKQPVNEPPADSPRWQEREEEWKKRFNSQEERHTQELQKIREEISDSRKANAQQTEIPKWFGGDKEQWEAYRADRDADLKAAEDRAYARINQEQSKQSEAVQAATDYMRSEIATIESDRTLNPSGLKIDPAKLLKIAMDTDGGLITPDGKWNYRAAFRIYRSEVKPPAPKPEDGKNNDRKKIAGAMNSEQRGDPKPATFKTSEDFRKNRPW